MLPIIFLLLLSNVAAAAPTEINTPIEINSINELKKAFLEKEPTFFMFYADWCNACKAMHEQYKKAAGAFKKEVHFYKINAENEAYKDIVDALGIEAVPTVIIKKIGFCDAEQLIQLGKNTINQAIVRTVQEPTQPQKKISPPAKKQTPKPTPAKKTAPPTKAKAPTKKPQPAGKKGK